MGLEEEVSGGIDNCCMTRTQGNYVLNCVHLYTLGECLCACTAPQCISVNGVIAFGKGLWRWVNSFLIPIGCGLVSSFYIFKKESLELEGNFKGHLVQLSRMWGSTLFLVYRYLRHYSFLFGLQIFQILFVHYLDLFFSRCCIYFFF